MFVLIELVRFGGQGQVIGVRFGGFDGSRGQVQGIGRVSGAGSGLRVWDLVGVGVVGVDRFKREDVLGRCVRPRRVEDRLHSEGRCKATAKREFNTRPGR